jgi:hypothetical protein
MYVIRWNDLTDRGSDGWSDLTDGQSGYLKSFASREVARLYALQYARTVAASYRDAGTVAVFTDPDYVILATCADGHRERITVTDTDS